MIDFSRAFDLAWERMAVILFRPFDLGKWLAIGLSAFLAALLSGGNGFNTGYQRNFNSGTTGHATWHYSSPSHSYQFDVGTNDFLHGPHGVLILLGIILSFCFFLGVVVLFSWLGARGQFLLLDNVVRNRGLIVWPWQHYARASNNLFRFYLAIFFLSLAATIPFAVAGVIMALPFFRQNRFPLGTELPPFIAFGSLYFVVLVIWWVALFLFRELGPPLMFRQGLAAWPASQKVWALVRAHPGPLVLFVLLRFALFVALAVISLVLCCVTCCVEMLPYVGTLILLPAIIFIKCFTLDFLAQFGPEYNVWIVDVPPVTPVSMAAPAPVDPSPPPPPG